MVIAKYGDHIKIEIIGDFYSREIFLGSKEDVKELMERLYYAVEDKEHVFSVDVALSSIHHQRKKRAEEESKSESQP